MNFDRVLKSETCGKLFIDNFHHDARGRPRCFKDPVREVHRHRIWDQLHAAGSHCDAICDSSDKVCFRVETLAQSHTLVPTLRHNTTLHLFRHAQHHWRQHLTTVLLALQTFVSCFYLLSSRRIVKRCCRSTLIIRAIFSTHVNLQVTDFQQLYACCLCPSQFLSSPTKRVRRRCEVPDLRSVPCARVATCLGHNPLLISTLEWDHRSLATRVGAHG